MQCFKDGFTYHFAWSKRQSRVTKFTSLDVVWWGLCNETWQLSARWHHDTLFCAVWWRYLTSGIFILQVTRLVHFVIHNVFTNGTTRVWYPYATILESLCNEWRVCNKQFHSWICLERYPASLTWKTRRVVENGVPSTEGVEWDWARIIHSVS